MRFFLDSGLPHISKMRMSLCAVNSFLLGCMFKQFSAIFKRTSAQCDFTSGEPCLSHGTDKRRFPIRVHTKTAIFEFEHPAWVFRIEHQIVGMFSVWFYPNFKFVNVWRESFHVESVSQL